MKSKLVSDDTRKTYVLIFEEGDEVLKEIENFAEINNLKDSHITAIGAFSEVTLGYFDLEKKDYLQNEINEQVEVLSLIGNVTRHEGKPKVHIHVTLGRKNFNAVGGHLLKGVVRPTLEVLLNESPEYLKRAFVEEFKLPLIKL